ncbi:unnamed protein product, partial [Laminaria digitata]
MSRTKSFAAIGPSHAAPHQRNPFLECATLFWLGQSDRALHALCRGPAAEHNATTTTSTAPSSLQLPAESMSTVVADGTAGLSICNRSIDVATRPFLVSKLKQLQAKSNPLQGRGGWRTSVGRGGSLLSSSNGDAAAGSGGGGSGGGGSAGAKRNNLGTAQRVAAVRLTTVEYLARNGMELSALEVLGSNAGGEWAAELAEQQQAA